MRIMKKIKDIIAKIRRYFIVKAAESYYKRMAQRCRELYKSTGLHHYIVIDPMYGGKIVIINRANFRAIKRAINDSGSRMLGIYGEGSFSKDTMYAVHDGSFFSTLLEARLNSPQALESEKRNIRTDIEARRRAYIQWTLEHADRPKRQSRREKRREERIIRKELKSYKKEKPMIM